MTRVPVVSRTGCGLLWSAAQIRQDFAPARVSVEPLLEIANAVIFFAELTPEIVLARVATFGAGDVALPIVEDHLQQVVVEIALDERGPLTRVEPHAFASPPDLTGTSHATPGSTLVMA